MYILTADWHLREDQPTCRTDDFQKAQWSKVDFVLELANKRKAGIIVAGDLFHKAKPGYSTVQRLIDRLRQAGVVLNCIAGNHDLPSHSLDLMESSGYGVVAASGWIAHLPPVAMFGNRDVLRAWHWGQKLDDLETDVKRKYNIAVLHELVFENKIPANWETTERIWKAKDLLDHLKGFQCVVTGHHHSFFCVEKDGRVLINPGSLTRQTASQEDHVPSVVLLNTKDRNCASYERILGPHKKSVVSRDHIEAVSKRDERIEQFVQSLDFSDADTLDFVQNIRDAIQKNQISGTVQKYLLAAIEEEPDVVRTGVDQNQEGNRAGKSQANPVGNGKGNEAEATAIVRRKNPYRS